MQGGGSSVNKMVAFRWLMVLVCTRIRDFFFFFIKEEDKKIGGERIELRTIRFESLFKTFVVYHHHPHHLLFQPH